MTDRNVLDVDSKKLGKVVGRTRTSIRSYLLINVTSKKNASAWRGPGRG
jgi:hypothetical protein